MNDINDCARSVVDNVYFLSDHLGGVDQNFKNKILDQLPLGSTCYTEYLFPDTVKQQYPHVDLKFSAWLNLTGNHLYSISKEANAINHCTPNFKNFLCSFNRADQLGRHWLVGLLYRKGWFNPSYSTKHFKLDKVNLAKINLHPGVDEMIFYKKIISFDFNQDPHNHKTHLHTLAPLIQDNFVTLVSETMAAESSIPFWTEKFLYPIANKRLWVAYAPQGYHQHLKEKFNFEMFPFFNYHFDTIKDPVVRLHTLLEMLEPFANMSMQQWNAIYEEHQGILERNYQHLANYGFFNLLVDLDEYEELEFDPDKLGAPMDFDELRQYANQKQGWTKKLGISPKKYKYY